MISKLRGNLYAKNDLILTIQDINEWENFVREGLNFMLQRMSSNENETIPMLFRLSNRSFYRLALRIFHEPSYKKNAESLRDSRNLQKGQLWLANRKFLSPGMKERVH